MIYAGFWKNINQTKYHYKIIILTGKCILLVHGFLIIIIIGYIIIVCYSKLDSLLAQVNFDQEYSDTAMTANILGTCSQFNVFSGVLIEWLDEPWHVGVCAAGKFQTTTLLSIPQDIIGEQHVLTYGNIIPRLTVVIAAYIGRDWKCASTVTWTIDRDTVCAVGISSSVCPYVPTWIAIHDR